MGKLVIVIVGPTCSGKSALALQIAGALKSHIISADSRQIYKHITIGTAKPSPTELKTIKHYFIDQLELDEPFDVSSYEKLALTEMDKMREKGKIPVVVGGSGLYIKALVDGIADIETDGELREELFAKKEKFGVDFLYQELTKVDAESAKAMLPQNWKRVIRALEVFYLTGKSITSLHKEKAVERNEYSFFQFGLEWPRAILYQKIEERVDKMFETGLVDEVESVLKMGYSEKLNSLNSVGYKEVIAYLNNEITLESAIHLIKRNTRHYAKRQMTWFRKDTRINWFKIENELDLAVVKTEILKLVERLHERQN